MQPNPSTNFDYLHYRSTFHADSCVIFAETGQDWETNSYIERSSDGMHYIMALLRYPLHIKFKELCK